MKARALRLPGGVTIPHVEGAFRMLDRMRGLLGRSGLPEGHALHIQPWNPDVSLRMSTRQERF